MYADTFNNDLIERDITDVSDLTYNCMVLKHENSANLPAPHLPKPHPFQNFSHCSVYLTPVCIVPGAAKCLFFVVGYVL